MEREREYRTEDRNTSRRRQAPETGGWPLAPLFREALAERAAERAARRRERPPAEARGQLELFEPRERRA